MDSRDDLPTAGFDDRPGDERGIGLGTDPSGEPESPLSSTTVLAPDLPPRPGTRRRARSSRWRRASRGTPDNTQSPRRRALPALLVGVVALGALGGALVWIDPEESASAYEEPDPGDAQVMDSSAPESEQAADQAPETTDPGSGRAEGTTSLEAPEAGDDEDEAATEDSARSEESQEPRPQHEQDSDQEHEQDRGNRGSRDRGESGPPADSQDDRPEDYDDWNDWQQDEYDQKGCEFWMWWC